MNRPTRFAFALWATAAFTSASAVALPKLGDAGGNAVAAAFGLESKAMADKTGMIVVAWWDRAFARKRLSVGYVGEGIEPNVWYRADDAGKLVKA
jgi:hypothetical protein